MSIDPSELKKLVENVKNVNLSIGNGKKTPLKCEIHARNFARRSIVANKNITKGEKYTEENICLKRPANGINASKFFKIIIQS